jgi:hypothetical protein
VRVRVDEPWEDPAPRELLHDFHSGISRQSVCNGTDPPLFDQQVADAIDSYGRI